MATMAREAWTDERLDDLNKRVDDGFREMRAEFRGQNDNMLGLHGRMHDLQQTMISQFAAQQRMMVQLFGGMFAMMLVGFLGVIATILTQT